MINYAIKKLITYGLEKGFFGKIDKVYITNLILEALQLDSYEEPTEECSNIDLESTLAEILDYAVDKGIIEDSVVYRDLFDTKLMGLMLPRPSEVIEVFNKKYGLEGISPLLFAVGDGNHSLATAKRCYEDLKKVTPESEWATLPARYALVEVVNNHDDALEFEPIHRVLFGVNPEDVLNALKVYYPNAYEGIGDGHVIAYTHANGQGSITIPDPKVQLAVGSLQAFIDAYLMEHSGEVDYIHGDDVTDKLGAKPGNIGFKVPGMEKEQLFKTVMADGVLPRKTFSMGHAADKRFYLECRKIR